MYIVAWVAGLLYFCSMFRGELIWGYDESQYAWSVVILMLLAFGSKFCGCCGWHGKMMGGIGSDMCKHDMGCKCGDCGRCK